MGMMVGNSPDFGVKNMGNGSKPHPDMSMKTAERPAMGDGDRAASMGIQHTKGMHPAQAAPRHGPQFERELGYRRDGKA